MGSAHTSTEKSPEAFRTISEVAAELDVPQHVLRFWETRFGQVRPLKRSGGRRYYRPEDIELLRGIRTLLYTEGLTIRGVQKILKEQGVKHVIGIGRGDMGVAETIAPSAAEELQRRQQPAPATQTSAAAEPGTDPETFDRQLSAEARRRLAEALDELEAIRKLLDRMRK